MRTLECPDDMQKNVIISSDKGFKNFLRLYGRLLLDQIIGALQCSDCISFGLCCFIFIVTFAFEFLADDFHRSGAFVMQPENLTPLM